MSAISSYRSLENISARERERSEGLARPARIRFFVRVAGSGESRLEGRNGIFFGAYMLEEPTFTFGLASVGELPVGTLPLATACVLRYQRSGKFYTGCDIGFQVESGHPGIVLNFSLTFEGTTLRTTSPMSGGIR